MYADFVLTYEEEQLRLHLGKVTHSRFNPCARISEITEENREERRAKREYFLRACLEKGLDYEPKNSKSVSMYYLFTFDAFCLYLHM